ncbi:hypothetical protein [Streptomyces sp. NPDC047097]|uniref:hypothetical protein n=1 Tax=Streptomyces sp. NPDC047097 TaxID=3155260 RepID=UPI0033C5ACC9
MTERRRRWLIGAGAALVLAGLVVFFVFQGLDRADKWAGVGSFLLGLGLAVYGLQGGNSPDGGGQSADGATAGGSINQVRGVAGDLTIGGSRPVPPPPPAGAAPPPPPTGGGQSARGARAGGGLNQVDGVGGSANIGGDGTGSGAP